MSQVELTQNALREGLKKCMDAEEFDNITVSMICESAGVSRRTFYRHYFDKYELLNSIFEKDFIEPYLSTKKDSLWDYHPIVCNILYENRKFYARALQVEGQNSFRSFVQSMVTDVIKKDIGEFFHNDVELECGVRVLLNMYYECYVVWLNQKEPSDPDAFSKSILTRSYQIFERMSEKIKDCLDIESESVQKAQK